VLVPHSTIPENQRGSVEGDPDAVVERLADVAVVVDRWSG
jgi:putative hydrolase of the HAD superfamily